MRNARVHEIGSDVDSDTDSELGLDSGPDSELDSPRKWTIATKRIGPNSTEGYSRSGHGSAASGRGTKQERRFQRRSWRIWVVGEGEEEDEDG